MVWMGVSFINEKINNKKDCDKIFTAIFFIISNYLLDDELEDVER